MFARSALMDTTELSKEMHVWVAVTFEEGYPIKRAGFSSKRRAMKWVEHEIRANVEWSGEDEGETRLVVTGFGFRDLADHAFPPAIVEQVRILDKSNFRRRWGIQHDE